MDSLSGAGRAAVLAPAGNQGNAPQDGGFAIVTMNIALAIHTLFAQAMLNPILSIFNIAFSATKTNSNSGTAMINTAVYGHSKEEPSVLRTLVDTGACCTFHVCLGFPKCGTTALFEAVEAHGGATVALRHPDTRSTEIGDRLFDAPLDPRTSYFCKTPTWILDEGAMARILAVAAKSHAVVAIVCVRDPAAQLSSYRRHRASVEGLEYPSMAAFCAARDVAKPALPYAACAHYLPHIRAAVRVFGGRLRVVHMGALGDWPRVAEFLDLPPLPHAAPFARASGVDDLAREFTARERADWDASFAATLDLLKDARVRVLVPTAGLGRPRPPPGERPSSAGRLVTE